MKHCCETAMNTGTRCLSCIPAGERVCLVALQVGRTLRSRLLAMGLIQGSEIRIIANQGSGPLLIGLGESRMTLGRGMAEQILVR